MVNFRLKLRDEGLSCQLDLDMTIVQAAFFQFLFTRINIYYIFVKFCHKTPKVSWQGHDLKNKYKHYPDCVYIIVSSSNVKHRIRTRCKQFARKRLKFAIILNALIVRDILYRVRHLFSNAPTSTKPNLS